MRPEKKSQDVYCKAPWVSMYLDTQGVIKPCCVSFDRLGKVDEDGFVKAYNSEKMTELRRQILKGEIPHGCRVCRRKDEVQSRARRFTYEDIQIDRELTEEGDHNLISQLDISFSNLCNLKCRFCGPFCSSKWIEDSKKLPDSDSNLWEGHKEFNFKVNHISAEEIMSQLDEFPNIRDLDINGGEPFMAPQHLEFLKLLVERGRASETRLIYTTNGTIAPDKYIPYLSQFKSVKVSVSTEGVGDVYRYSRCFSEAEDRLEKTMESFAKIPGVRFGINYTMSALNIFGVADFWPWFLKIHEKYNVAIHMGVVVAPYALQISNLPLWFREEAYEQLPKDDHPALAYIRNLLFQNGKIPDENGNDCSPERKLELFWEHVDTLDRIQNTSLTRLQPIYEKVRPARPLDHSL